MDAKGAQDPYGSVLAGRSRGGEWVNKSQEGDVSISLFRQMRKDEPPKWDQRCVSRVLWKREVSGGSETPRSSDRAGPQKPCRLDVNVNLFEYICISFRGGVDCIHLDSQNYLIQSIHQA